MRWERRGVRVALPSSAPLRRGSEDGTSYGPRDARPLGTAHFWRARGERCVEVRASRESRRAEEESDANMINAGHLLLLGWPSGPRRRI